MKPVFLIDLGGVLIDLNWIDSAKKIFGSSENKDNLHEKWLKLKSVRKFETGISDFETFTQELSNEIALSVTPNDIKTAFINIIGDIKPNCSNALTQLKKIGTLAMLSNTNSIHIDKLKSETNLFSHFDKVYLSYRLKCVKPDKQIFDKVIADLDCNANNIYFFDDSKTNIEAAKRFGLNAFQVTSPTEILDTVTKLFESPL